MRQPDPIECEELTDLEKAALRHVHAGDATSEQQRLALGVIVNKFARAHDLHIVFGQPDATGFMNGRAFVGKKILKYLNLPVGQIE